MKQKSNTRPSRVQIDVINDMAHVSLFDNIKRVEVVNEVSDNSEDVETTMTYEYEYDHYIVKVIN